MSSSPMNHAIVKRLILKDWYFQRWPIYGYLAAGAVALVLVAAGSEASFYAGTILMFTVLIALGIQLPMATVISERKEQTLPFVMSLPVSPREYATAKVLANLLILFIPWAILTFGCLAVLAGRTGLPGGLIPFGAIALTELLASSCLLLLVALATESQGWTIGVMVTCNLVFQGFLYWVSHIPSIAGTMNRKAAVWSPAAVTLLLSEIGVIGVALGLCFYFQSRKTDFI
jgi:ABC-2 type transport system permease protein